MLDASRLMGAGAETSKNQLVSGLLNEVKLYNNIVSPANPKPKADQLMRICQVGGWYCTSKPPQPPKAHKPSGGKNVQRWAAVKDLLEQVGAEVAALGLRMLSGPADFKAIGAHSAAAAPGTVQKKASYWLEMIDPQHRAGFLLAPQFETWISDPGAIANKESFWEFIGTNENPLPADIAVKYYPELVGQAAKFGIDRGLLHFDGGQLLDIDDDVWDTRDSVTHFSGKGWAIFVVSPEGKLYGGSHKAAKHHHSSFLGGGMVLAAGEMACYDGIPRFITAKSGHYAPTPENMRNFVNKFLDIRGDTLIQPKITAIPVFYKVQDFRLNGLAAPPVNKLDVTAWLSMYHLAASFAAPNGSKGFRDTWDKLV